MKQKYSEAFIEQAVVKLLSRGKRTVREVALDINVNHHTAKNWMQRGSPDKAAASPTKEKRPQDWSAQEQLLALQETHVLSGEALQAWCRERGLFAHYLASWKTAFCTAEKKTDAGMRELRSLKDQNDQLRRELVRKEKALAEAAALLILQKKFRAVGGRGQMSRLSQRHQVRALVGQAITAGARQERTCGAISLSARTLQRWQRDPSRGDQRPARAQAPKNRLSGLERQALLAVANSAKFGHLSPSQIVPRLADAGQYIASESTFYRVLRAECQL
jgi:transposase